MKSTIHRHNGWILADGHVHIHKQFTGYSCLDWAFNNFTKAAGSLELTGMIDRVLFLTETATDNWFDKHRNIAEKDLSSQPSHYRCGLTAEKNSLYFENESSDRLFVIAGRQIISSERLEVLALGLKGIYPDGQPVRKILSDIQQTGCLAVLPWGVGKWLGTRGVIVASLFKDLPKESILLGDSGNRPFFWPLSSLFNPNGQQPPGNLPGSDPLPLANQEKRIGSYGFMLKGPLDRQTPFQDLREKISESKTPIKTFGRPERLFPFISNQIAMQLNRGGKSC